MRLRLTVLLAVLALPAPASALDTSKFAGCVADAPRGSCRETWVGGDLFGAVFINQSGHAHRYTLKVFKKGTSKVVFRRRHVRKRFVPLTGLSAGRFQVRWYVGSTQVGGWAFRQVVESER